MEAVVGRGFMNFWYIQVSSLVVIMVWCGPVGWLVGWPTQRIIHQRARERILHDYLILMTVALPGYVSIAVSAQQIRFLVEFHVANLSSSMKKFPASCHRCPCNECLLCAPFDLLYFGEQPKRTAGAMVKAIMRGRGSRRGSSGVLSLRIVLNEQPLLLLMLSS